MAVQILRICLIETEYSTLVRYFVALLSKKSARISTIILNYSILNSSNTNTLQRSDASCVYCMEKPSGTFT